MSPVRLVLGLVMRCEHAVFNGSQLFINISQLAVRKSAGLESDTYVL